MVFLMSPETKMPESQTMTFSRMRNPAVPPYLLNFRGSPAERHVENLKVTSIDDTFVTSNVG